MVTREGHADRVRATPRSRISLRVSEWFPAGLWRGGSAAWRACRPGPLGPTTRDSGRGGSCGGAGGGAGQVDALARMLRALPPRVDAAVERLLRRVQASHAPPRRCCLSYDLLPGVSYCPASGSLLNPSLLLVVLPLFPPQHTPTIPSLHAASTSQLAICSRPCRVGPGRPGALPRPDARGRAEHAGRHPACPRSRAGEALPPPPPGRKGLPRAVLAATAPRAVLAVTAPRAVLAVTAVAEIHAESGCRMTPLCTAASAVAAAAAFAAAAAAAE
jgi:hypothetical protein